MFPSCPCLLSAGNSLRSAAPLWQRGIRGGWTPWTIRLLWSVSSERFFFLFLWIPKNKINPIIKKQNVIFFKIEMVNSILRITEIDCKIKWFEQRQQKKSIVFPIILLPFFPFFSFKLVSCWDDFILHHHCIYSIQKNPSNYQCFGTNPFLTNFGSSRWDRPAVEPAPGSHGGGPRPPQVCKAGQAPLWARAGALLWDPQEKHPEIQQLHLPHRVTGQSPHQQGCSSSASEFRRRRQAGCEVAIRWIQHPQQESACFLQFWNVFFFFFNYLLVSFLCTLTWSVLW